CHVTAAFLLSEVDLVTVDCVGLLVYRLQFYFFFQAEDGIRDRTVTGVQTCALPICHSPTSVPGRCSGNASGVATARETDDETHRSEERRVGKECRSRWWTYH